MNERILPFKTFKNTEYILYYIHLKYFFRIKNKKLCMKFRINLINFIIHFIYILQNLLMNPKMWPLFSRSSDDLMIEALDFFNFQSEPC